MGTSMRSVIAIIKPRKLDDVQESPTPSDVGVFWPHQASPLEFRS
jgi:hypothetical protein